MARLLSPSVSRMVSQLIDPRRMKRRPAPHSSALASRSDAAVIRSSGTGRLPSSLARREAALRSRIPSHAGRLETGPNAREGRTPSRCASPRSAGRKNAASTRPSHARRDGPGSSRTRVTEERQRGSFVNELGPPDRRGILASPHFSDPCAASRPGLASRDGVRPDPVGKTSCAARRKGRPRARGRKTLRSESSRRSGVLEAPAVPLAGCRSSGRGCRDKP